MAQPAQRPNLSIGNCTIPNDAAVNELVPCLTVQELGRLGQVGPGQRAFVQWYFDNNPYLYTLKGMPELGELTKGDSIEYTKERLTVCGRAREKAKQLYGGQRGRYVWAKRMGGKLKASDRNRRNETHLGFVTVLTTTLGLAMGLNIVGRSIFQRSFSHIKTWYRRYLLVFFTPPTLGAGAAITFIWADRQFKEVPRPREAKDLLEVSPQELQTVGAYGILDKDHFILLSTIRALAAHLEATRESAVQSADADNRDVINEWANREKEVTDEGIKEAYLEGCYRIHCAGLAANGEHVPSQPLFDPEFMRRRY